MIDLGQNEHTVWIKPCISTAALINKSFYMYRAGSAELE